MRDDPPPFCFRKMNREGKQAKDGMEPMIYDRLIEYCLVILIVFTPFTYGAVEPWSITVFEVIAAMMFLSWILKNLKKGELEFVRNPLILFISLFIIYVSLQFFVSRYIMYDRHTVPGSIYPWATQTELLKVISYVLIFFVATNTIKTRQQITRILSIIITVGFLMSVFFLMRYFGAKTPPGIINPDHFSGYLGMIIPLTLGLLFIRHATYDIRYTRYAKRFLIFFCVIIMGTALFFTMSRGGMFSFITALLFMAVLVLTRKSIRKKGWILSAVLIFVILAIAWLGATPVVERILSVEVEIASRYFGGRLPIWQGTVDIIKDYPIFGTGLGTFNYIFPKYQPKTITEHYTHAHSDFLELFSEVGIIGFFLFAVCGLLSVGWLFCCFRKRHDPYVVGISIGIFGSLASIFVHSLVDFNLHIPANAILVTIILSLFLSLLNYKRDIRPTTYELRHTKFILYPITMLMISIFVVSSVRPALADYYFRKTKDEMRNIKLAIKLEPLNALYHYQLGRLYSKRNTIYDIQYTIKKYKKAIELNPANSKYHQSLAWSYGQLADLSQTSVKRNTKYEIRYTNLAHKHFQEAIRLDPNNPYRHRAYAFWLFNHPTKENIEKGVVGYKKAIELEPELSNEALDSFYRLTKSYESLGKIIPETGTGYLISSNYLEKKGLSDESVELKRKAIAKLILEAKLADLKKKVEIYMKLAEVYRTLGENDKAIRKYQELLKIDPQNSWPYLDLAMLFKQQGKPSKAKKMWQAILNLKNPAPDAERIARKELKKYEVSHDNNS